MKGSLRLFEHRRFIGCEKNYACFQDAFPYLAAVYARHVLSSKSDMVRSKGVVEARKLLVKRRQSLRQGERLVAVKCKQDLLLCRHSMYISCISLGICTRLKRYLQRTGPSFFCNDLKSGAHASRL